MKNLKNETLSQFCEQFSMILSSGMSSMEGLQILGGDALSEKSKNAYELLCQDLEESGSLAHAMKASGLFPADMTAYVAVGEESGTLDSVMKDLARRYEQEHDLEHSLRSAVTYPTLMLLMMGTVTVILLVKVLPVFSQVFHQMGMEMNGISLRLLHIGNMLRTYSGIWILILFLLSGCILFFLFHPKGKQTFQRLLIRLPYVHRIPEAYDRERFSYGIAMGLHAALSPERSMELAAEMVRTPLVKKSTSQALSLLNEGAGLSEALTQSGLYSGMDRRMIELSFQTGTTDQVLNRIGDRIHEESYELTLLLIQRLEPAMVILLGIMVGLVLLSVMLPLFGLLTQMTV